MSRIKNRIVEIRIGLAGQKGMAWRDPLFVEFHVEKTTGRSPNKAEVKLYNLSPNSLRQIEQPDQILQILAGQEIPSQIFYGDIPRRGVEHKPTGTDLVTTIKAADGRRIFRDSTFSGSYPPGISRDAILKDIISSGNIPISYQTDLPSKSYPSGWAYAGTWRDALTEILDSDASWSIQHGALQILKINEAPGNALLITSNTGMIGSPNRTDKGVNVKTLLTPALRSGGPIKIESQFLTGDYKITKLVHEGNSRGLIWESQIVGRPI